MPFQNEIATPKSIGPGNSGLITRPLRSLDIFCDPTLALVFERSSPGKRGYQLPALDVPAVDAAAMLGAENVRMEIEDFPEISEVDAIRQSQKHDARPLKIAWRTRSAPLVIDDMDGLSALVDSRAVEQIRGSLARYRPKET